VPPPPLLGLDLFSLRSQGLSAIELLEFCAARAVGVVHFSEPRLLGAAGAAALRDVRVCAQELGIALEAGMLSIARGSTIFNAAAGPAESQLSEAIDLAVALGSPIVRCVVGTFRDRAQTGGPGDPGGIDARVGEAIAAIGAVRTRALDAGLKIAVENHAGDLQSRELKALVEEAGTDLVGVCLDAGNAFWAMEDALAALETLAPCVLTSHTRDTAVRATESGAEVAWTRMGEGNIGIDAYLDRFGALCPGKPVMLEVIIMPAPRQLPYRDPQFRAGYPRMSAEDFQRFVDRVEHAPPAALPSGVVDPAAELANVEASLRWTTEYLRR
jgi:sugar phosphate isomerase/epimerase